MPDLPEGLYAWLGLAPHVRSGVSLESLVSRGGDWRTRLRAVILASRGQRPQLYCRKLGKDALLVDGRLRAWDLQHPTDARASNRLFFERLHSYLAQQLAKPWVPELSPCQLDVLEEILATLGFTRSETVLSENEFCQPDPDDGTWLRHLSRRETTYLRDALAKGDYPRPLQAQIKVDHVEWQWPGHDLSPERVSLAILRSASHGQSGHFDRWGTPLPHVGANEAESDREVRMMFRAMTARLALNGRFIPGKHLYFVSRWLFT